MNGSLDFWSETLRRFRRYDLRWVIPKALATGVASLPGNAVFSGDSGVAMPRERRLFCRLLGLAVDVTGVTSLQETRSLLVIAVIPVSRCRASGVCFCRLLGVGGGRDWRHVATGDAVFSGDSGVAMPRERRLFCRLLGRGGGRDWRRVATG